MYVVSKIVSTMQFFFPHVLSTPIDLNVLTSPKSTGSLNYFDITKDFNNQSAFFILL